MNRSGYDARVDFTAKPCKRGHVAERYSHNGECVVCARLRAARWKKTAKGKPIKPSTAAAQKCGNIIESIRMNGRTRGALGSAPNERLNRI